MRAILISAVMVLASFGFAFGQAIMVDHVDGLDDPVEGTFSDGATLTFYMRIVGDATPHLMLNNGYTFSSDDLVWGGLTGAYNTADYPAMEDWFDFVMVMNFWADGVGEDTVGTGLLSLFGTGLAPSFDGILYTFSIGPINGLPGHELTLDSSWYPPSNPWMWDIVGENVGWGGPYLYKIGGTPPPVSTYCTPQPTVLKEIEDILYVHICNEDNDAVDWATIRVQSKIPPYLPVFEEGFDLVTTCFIMRFLGSSGFRPVTGDFEATYTVDYSYLDGTAADQLVGDFALKVYPGDVTMDGQTNMNDIIFAADYFWRGGGVPTLTDNNGQAWDCAELLDCNQDGSTDPRDVIEIINIVY